MSQSPLSLPQARGLGQTQRKDKWWLQPLVVFLGLGAFVVYSTWAAFQGAHYEFGPYLSPMYSPLLFDAGTAFGTGSLGHHTWFGAWPGWIPAWVPASPALLILSIPAGFRTTCYYYRGAYYKAFWADPLNCAVGEPRNGYRGENFWPLLVQNIHRYLFYLAALYIVILAYDAVVATQFQEDWAANGGRMLFGGEGGAGFGIGIGTLILTLNVILLGGYTFGCHCARHFSGGNNDHHSKLPLGKKTYECISCLNRNHMKWAWFSLIWVGFTDFYIRMVSMGIWIDWRLF
jgi:hypothetical protein